MSKEKCDYCGQEVEAEAMSTLENGSPACLECVNKESEKTIVAQPDDNQNEPQTKGSFFQKLKKWIVSNKKRAIIVFGAILLALVLVVVLVTVVGNRNNSDSSYSSSSSTEDTLESLAKTKATGHYKFKYDVSSVRVEVASVQKQGSKWRVAGKVYAKDPYGDSYSGNWSIIYDANLNAIEENFATPRKD